MGRLLMVATVVFLIGACGDDTSSEPDQGSSRPDSGTVGDVGVSGEASAEISFSKQIQPILSSTCAKSGCHMGATPKGKMDLSEGKAYASLMQNATLCPGNKRAEPGNADESFIVQKLEGKGSCFAGKQMPLVGGPLDAATIKRIRDWITEGAKNN